MLKKNRTCHQFHQPTQKSFRLGSKTRWVDLRFHKLRTNPLFLFPFFGWEPTHPKTDYPYLSFFFSLFKTPTSIHCLKIQHVRVRIKHDHLHLKQFHLSIINPQGPKREDRALIYPNKLQLEKCYELSFLFFEIHDNAFPSMTELGGLKCHISTVPKRFSVDRGFVPSSVHGIYQKHKCRRLLCFLANGGSVDVTLNANNHHC